MPAVINREMGSIIIENNVLASIAGMSAMESYGIVGMASKNATVLEYGVRISTVGQNIIDNVKFRIKELTNLEPDQVSVIVEGIRIK